MFVLLGVPFQWRWQMEPERSLDVAIVQRLGSLVFFPTTTMPQSKAIIQSEKLAILLLLRVLLDP